MIVVKKEHHQEAKRYGYEHPLNIESPEWDHPTTRLCRFEGANCRYSILLCSTQTSREVREANPKKGGKDE